MRASLEFPLLKRELVGLLRTKRAFWLLVSTIIISSLVPLLTWPDFWASGAQDPQQNAMRFSGFVITRGLIWGFATGAIALNVLVIVGDHAAPVVVTCLALSGIVIATHLVRSLPTTRLAIRHHDPGLFGRAE